MKILFIVFLLFGCHWSFGQPSEKEYHSQQEELYHKSRGYRGFEPAPVSAIKDFTNRQVIVRKQNTNNPFVSIGERPKHLAYYDSLVQICRDKLWKITGPPNKAVFDWVPARYFKYTDSLEKAGVVQKVQDKEVVAAADDQFSACLDSVEDLMDRDSIAGINPRFILRCDSLGAKKILLYKEHGLTEFDLALWLAVSEDHGKSWRRYFTGLIERQFYYVKPNPTLRLIKNDSVLQLEVALLRQLTPWTMPVVSAPEYELLEDHLVLDLNVNMITSDRDHDGLTDLTESRLLTDPHSKDTDHDGIDDAVDTNPRFKSVKNEYTNLIKFLLEPNHESDTLISFVPVESKEIYGRRKSTRYIVTDDVHVMGLGKTSDTYIILKTKEYQEYQKKNPGSPDDVSISPFFAVDNMPGTWKVRLTFGFYGYTCIVTKSKTGWLVKFIESWIS